MTSPRYVLYCHPPFSACASKKIHLFPKKSFSTKNYICFPKTEIYSRHLSLAILKFLHCRFCCKRLIFQQNLAEKNKEKLFIFAACPPLNNFHPSLPNFSFFVSNSELELNIRTAQQKNEQQMFEIRD